MLSTRVFIVCIEVCYPSIMQGFYFLYIQLFILSFEHFASGRLNFIRFDTQIN